MEDLEYNSDDEQGIRGEKEQITKYYDELNYLDTSIINEIENDARMLWDNVIVPFLSHVEHLNITYNGTYLSRLYEYDQTRQVYSNKRTKFKINRNNGYTLFLSYLMSHSKAIVELFKYRNQLKANIEKHKRIMNRNVLEIHNNAQESYKNAQGNFCDTLNPERYFYGTEKKVTSTVAKKKKTRCL